MAGHNNHILASVSGRAVSICRDLVFSVVGHQPLLTVIVSAHVDAGAGVLTNESSLLIVGAYPARTVLKIEHAKAGEIARVGMTCDEK